MTSKRKKTASSASRHKYTTREIMEITEKRRLEREAAEKPAELRTKNTEPAPQNNSQGARIIENTYTLDPVPPAPVIKQENTVETGSKPEIPPNALMGSLFYILALIALLMLFSKLSGDWVNAAANKINALIVYGSFSILSIFQVPSTVDEFVLNTHYYKLSLLDDLTAFYSMELLIIFALLFAFFQKITRINRGVVFIALVPLAIFANIFRVVVACGLALNYGTEFANRYFHGILSGFVFINIILGLIFLEYLSSPE